MVPYIIVKAFAADPFYNSAGHIVIKVAVLVCGSGLIIIIAFYVVGAFSRVDSIQSKIALAVIDTCRVAHDHSQGNNSLRKLWIAYGKAYQLTDVVIKG